MTRNRCGPRPGGSTASSRMPWSTMSPGRVVASEPLAGGAARRSALPWWVLAASLALTGLVAYLAGAAAEARDQVRFRNAALGAEARIVGRLEVYVALLRGGAGLFA